MRGSWPCCPATSWPRQAADVDDELDVALAVGGSPVGASTARADGRAVDLDAVPSDARTVRPIGDGPLEVTVADLDGLTGGGWREPGLLLGAGMALSILVGALVLVLARGRAGALRVASEAQLARDRTEENFRAVVQHLSDLVIVTDASTMISFVTPSVTRLLGREATSLPGGFLGDLVHPDDRSLLAALTSRTGVSEKGLIRFRHSDGSHRSFEVVVANRLDDPAIGGLVLTAHDVTDRVKLEDRLAHEATHDDLTGLPNRALIHDRLEHALVRASRTGGRVRRWSSVTSTASSRSTTSTATSSVTACCRGWPAACGGRPGRWTPWAATAATSSWSCVRSWRTKRGPAWPPSASIRRWPAPSTSISPTSMWP